jgi:hypothetical protein
MRKSQAKKWIDPQDVEITDARHKAFIDAEVAGETAEDQNRALQAAIEQWWLQEKGLTDATTNEQQDALVQMRTGLQTLESDIPDQQVPLKMLKKLIAEQYGASAHLAEANIKYRDGIRQDNKDKLGAAGRESRSRNAEARKCAIIADYKKNKGVFTKKEFAYRHYANNYNIGWTTVREYLTGV